MKEVIIKKEKGNYRIPKLLKLNLSKKIYKFEYNGKLYNKELKTDNKNIYQLSLLVEALNIKNKRQRYEFIYDKACDLLDNDFYGKNVCEFKNGKCIKNRKCHEIGDGCCCSVDHKTICQYLTDKGCSVRCLACKFHICRILKDKGYKYRLNDIYILKYLLNWKQKIIVYNDFFITKDEVLNDILKNSIILWSLKPVKKFIKIK